METKNEIKNNIENIINVMPCLNELQKTKKIGEILRVETENREAEIIKDCTDVYEINCSSKDVCKRENKNNNALDCSKNTLLNYLPYFD